MRKKLTVVFIMVFLLSACGDVSREEVSSEIMSETETQADTFEETICGTEENETSAESAPTQPSTISIIMAGDVLLHTPVAESGLLEDASYDFTALFENVKDEVQTADLALVNQEVIIGGTELGVSGYPCFNAPYELGDALIDAGFDVALQATNHALDKGRKGLLNCLAYWNEHPKMEVLGIHDSAEDAEEIYIYEQDGMKIAILNYTYGTNGIALPEDMPYAVDYLEEEKVIADIAKAEEMADFTIVCPHWGTEYNLGISAQQEEWTKLFLENGVDLVIGTHPHVIEPLEWVSDEKGNEMLVYYSLGNFLNWTSGTGRGVSNRMVGGMARVELQQDEDGEVFISDYGVEPLITHLEEGPGGVTTYFMEAYTQEMAAKNAIIAQDATFSLAYCEELCRQVWGEAETLSTVETVSETKNQKK